MSVLSKEKLENHNDGLDLLVLLSLYVPSLLFSFFFFFFLMEHKHMLLTSWGALKLLFFDSFYFRASHF